MLKTKFVTGNFLSVEKYNFTFSQYSILLQRFNNKEFE